MITATRNERKSNMDAELRLPNVYKVQNPDQFKLHLACYNGQVQPLEVFVRDREEWDDWNTWRSSRDDFSREYIFALIDFYHEKDTWLFGGAYKVLSRRPKDRSHSYKVQLLTDSQPWVGRLKLRLKRPSRGKAINL